jgi:hypothetical protein
MIREHCPKLMWIKFWIITAFHKYLQCFFFKDLLAIILWKFDSALLWQDMNLCQEVESVA